MREKNQITDEKYISKLEADIADLTGRIVVLRHELAEYRQALDEKVIVLSDQQVAFSLLSDNKTVRQCAERLGQHRIIR